MKIKKCVGAILYNEQERIFLMTSQKWKGWLVPGGRIEEGETEEEALRREIREELGIGIDNLVRAGESIKFPSPDFKDPKLTFHFISYFAKALQTKITPNDEILDYDWFTIEDALNLPLLDATRNLINKYQKHI